MIRRTWTASRIVNFLGISPSSTTIITPSRHSRSRCYPPRCTDGKRFLRVGTTRIGGSVVHLLPSALPPSGRQGSQDSARPKIAVAGRPVRDLRLHHVGRIPVDRRQVKEMLAPLRIGLGHGQPFKLLSALAAGCLCTAVRIAIGHGFKSKTSFAKIATGIATGFTTIGDVGTLH